MTPTKVHCLFEQSGTFKNEFIKLGIPAEDYDIQNHYGETDNVVDLFVEIENAYEGKNSIFDQIGGGDLIMAFFPCTYFCEINQVNFSFTSTFYNSMTFDEKIEAILERAYNRFHNYKVLIKLFAIAERKRLKMIVENPYNNGQNYLINNFLIPPTFIDINRQLRGDYFVKPTAYWFIGFKPTVGSSYQAPKEKKLIKNTGRGSALEASNTRSLISPNYARNFISDSILGRPQVGLTQLRCF